MDEYKTHSDLLIDPERDHRHREFINTDIKDTITSQLRGSDNVRSGSTESAKQSHFGQSIGEAVKEEKNKEAKGAKETGSKAGNQTSGAGSNSGYGNDFDPLPEKKNPLKVGAKAALKEFESQLGETESSDFLERSKGVTTKYGYKSFKQGLKASIHTGKGVINTGVNGYGLVKDIKSGAISGREAGRLIASGAKGASLTSGKASLNVMGKGAIRAVEDFKGSDDLGMQTIVKTKNAIFKTKRAIETGKFLHGLGKKMLPIIIKTVASLVVIVVIIAAVSSIVTSVVSILPTFSVKSEAAELSATYEYITKLDAEMEYSIIQEDNNPHVPKIDEYKYFYNGVSVPEANMTVYTDADMLLMYFDSKYQDYTFLDVKNEIDTIHKELHKVKTTTGTRKTSSNKKIHWMKIYLTTGNVEDYIKSHLTAEEMENYKMLQEIGAYTFRAELANPFDDDWYAHQSTRFGWRVHPIDKVLDYHPALDLAYPAGTPIKAVSAGTVNVPKISPSYGKYLKIKEGDNYTLYAHMSKIAVKDGAVVKPGDVIGYVGSTGKSTGPHLHIEYFFEEHFLNPAFFLERPTS